MKEIKLDTIAEDFVSQRNLDIVRKTKKVDIVIYFDNSVIRGMIEGIAGMETGIKIDKQRFAAQQTLVQSLAYFGAIRNIHILPPHQDELVDFLSNKHLLPDITRFNTEDVINDLLYNSDLQNIDKLKEYIDKGEIEAYLESFKHKAVQLYKINYLLKGIRWDERLKRIITFQADSPVIIDDKIEGFEQALSLPIFKMLVDIFNSERKQKTKNNFRDALSLTLIKDMVDQYHKNRKVIPIFFASTYVIRKIKGYPHIMNQFDVVVATGEQSIRINVLRDSYFFILDVLFSVFDKEKLPAAVFEKITYLKYKFESKALNEAYSLSNLETELEEFIFQDTFFREFWFEKMTKENLNETIREVVSYDFLKNDREVMSLIEDSRKLNVQKLSKNLQKLELIEKVWLKVDQFIEDRKVLFIFTGTINVFTDLGLTRFSPVLCDDIQGIFDAMLHASDTSDDDFFTARNKMIGYVMNGIYQRQYDDLVVAVSVLWLFNKHDLIIRILNLLNFEYGEYYQLALFHAASVYPINYERKEIVTQILAPYVKKATSPNYKLWIGIGFIYYHIWKSKSGKRFVPEDSDSISKHDAYIIDAILFTRQAYYWLKGCKDQDKTHLRNTKYYYALNNLLYFKVRIENYRKEYEWKDLAEELRSCKDMYRNLYWQPRFDHTLAIYEYRLYLINKKHKLKPVRSYLDQALLYINSALKGMAIHKDDYFDLYMKIKTLLEEDFQVRVSDPIVF